MNKVSLYIALSSILLSCKTTVTPVIETYTEPQVEIETDETSDDETIVDESIKTYNLTVLKGGSYPEIKNDTPFSDIELRILQNSDGIEIPATNEIAHYFKYFLRDKHDLLENWIENSRPYLPEIRKQFIEAGLPEELIYLPFLESGYNVMAYSRAGAAGIWQFMPRTANSYGLRVNWWVDERRSPQLATPSAISHLNYLNNKYNDWYLTLASYNAGEGRISRAMDAEGIYNYFDLIETDVLPEETKKYVPQYLAIVKIMKNMEELGFSPINLDQSYNLSVVKVEKGTDLIELCNYIGMSWSTFIKYNPIFRRKVSDPSYICNINIPSGLSDKTVRFINNNRNETGKNFRYYYVKSGDSWWYLSKLTNTPIVSLKRLNNINSNVLNIGQKILLPEFNEPIKTQSIQTVSTYQPSTEELETYTVKSGDTISSISLRYNIKLNSLYRENGLNSYSILKIGQVLRLPGYPINESTKTESKNSINTQNYYTVENGDSVWLIAQKTKVPYQQILNLNNLNSNSKLKIGDRILLY